MIASQNPGTEAATGAEGSSSGIRRKSARQALTDRASRGFSRVHGFKLRQEKSTPKNKSSAEEAPRAPERSPVWRRRDRKGASQSGSTPNSDANAVESRASEGGRGVSISREEDLSSGGCGHLTKLVLKFTTASESDVQPSCEIGTAGASIGKSEENTVSIPSDTMLAPLNHAVVKYENAPCCYRRVDGGGSGEEVASSEGELSTPDKEEKEAGLFFFSDGGQGTDFAAALRIRMGGGNRDWPLAQGCHFSAGLTVFNAHRTPPPSAGTWSHNKDQDPPTLAANRKKTGDCIGEEGEKKNEAEEVSTATNDAQVSSRAISGRLWLEVLAGCLKGQVWEVGADGATIGRASDNNLSLSDKEMSRRHSKIEYHAPLDEFYLCDLGSLNGTYMQMVGPYASRRRLGLGDHLLVGRTGFSVNRFDYGISERMGARPSMEDRSTVIQDLNLRGLAGSLLWPQTFAAVYDGHGGGEASEYLWSNLHVKLSNSLSARSRRLLIAAAAAELAGACADRSAPTRSQNLLARAISVRKALVKGSAGDGAAGGGVKPWEELDAVVKEAICEAFAAADEEFIATSRSPEAGSTATTCLILGPRLYIANVGDSRTVLCRSGKLRLATNDHKPNRADEQERVQKAGGFVAHRRVMGELAVSRAFGDSEFKIKARNVDAWGGAPVSHVSGERGGSSEEDATQLITAEPEFLVSEIGQQDHFVVLACDGIFDVLSSNEVVTDVWEKMKQHKDAQRCCEDLTEKAILERRTRDNVSLVLLVFNKWY